MLCSGVGRQEERGGVYPLRWNIEWFLDKKKSRIDRCLDARNVVQENVCETISSKLIKQTNSAFNHQNNGFSSHENDLQDRLKDLHKLNRLVAERDEAGDQKWGQIGQY